MVESLSELQQDVEKLERKQAENPEGRYFVPLANAYRRLGDPARAEALLREGLQRHPEYLSAHIVLGRCLADRGATRPAAEEYRYVLSLDPQNLIALRSLGDLALAEGDPREAERWYRELLGVDPLNDEARRALESLESAAPRARPDPSEWSAAAAEGAPATPTVLPESRAATVEQAPPPPPAEPWDAAGEAEEEVGGGLVTETIAELYARQGLYERSAEVYRELLRRRGGDPALEGRLREVERLARAEESAAPAAEVPPAEVPFGEAPFVDVPVMEPGVDALELDAGRLAEDEASLAEYLSPVPVEPEPAAPEPRAASPDERAEEPPIGGFLRSLAAWSPVGAGGTAAQAVEVDAAVPSLGGTGPAGADPLWWDPSPAVEAPAPAEGVAREEPFPFGDRPAGEMGPLPAPAVEREEGPPARREPGLPAAASTEEDDLESFQAWLRSLKR